ncbi:dUTP diphosphatase [Enterococcus xiangfangensis]|uniref:dUTP diphosphatase n=1 Tax=Enterococcus xiangfangensis TaxID=1296537 RepID=UPI0010F8A6AB|nr:dUTP diphosphatase [Enterococcus xiangfangensis]MBM7711978.1 dUTP pyrophosphatase [Enterococcus xiangfangensis]NBK08058.1 dUTP diphosphatase [Enterococcus asini]
MRKRGFEVIAAYQDQAINLPKRATKNAAGYDFEAAEDIVIPAVWKQIIQHFVKGSAVAEKVVKPVLVPTGIKAYMNQDEYLQLANRSSNPLKRFLALSNGVGVIDSDYYDNPDNEGHIMFQFSNFGLADVQIKKGERIGQGIFLPFLKADNDEATVERTGGFGSSDNQ